MAGFDSMHFGDYWDLYSYKVSKNSLNMTHFSHIRVQGMGGSDVSGWIGWIGWIGLDWMMTFFGPPSESFSLDSCRLRRRFAPAAPDQ